MKIYINGCSHSTSYAWPVLAISRVSWPFYVHFLLNKQHHNISFDMMNDDSIISHLSSRKNNRYWLNQPSFLQYSIPRLYKNEFDIFVKNKRNDIDYFISDAGDGKGNDSIFYETWNRLQDLELKKELPDFCIIQWSGHSRNTVTPIDDDLKYVEIPDYYSSRYGRDNQDWVDAIVGQHKDEERGSHVLHLETDVFYSTPNDKLNSTVEFSQLVLEPYASLRTLNHMIILQEYLKSKNINYIFLNYFEMDKRITKYDIFNKLDLTKFVTHSDDAHPLWDSWIDYILKGYTESDGKKTTLSQDVEGHPNVIGKKILCNRTVEKYNKLYDTTYINGSQPLL